jgi:outer membrane receptor protein involved in Fe transport
MCCAATDLAAADNVLDEIVVRADFRGRAASELPGSVALLDEAQIEGLALQHFEELINVIPNFNWSGDGHRARYFQIRGVGELEQYQGAPNPSVGFIVDDIDFSGIGTIATLFDIERVEVLRGPQGSRYGANALAGLVYVQSVMPAADQTGRLQVMAGSDAMWSAGIAAGGAFGSGERALYRVSAHHHRSNGFRDNPYLGRDDTNDRDETTVRGRLSLTASRYLDVDLAALFSDIDDGYDAFALDNSYTTLSDKPGKDAQRSIGASARLAWSGWADLQLTSITAFADSAIDFSFDADWGNDESWAPVVYDYTTTTARQRRTLSQELRFASDTDGDLDWLLGLYFLHLEDGLDSLNEGEYYDPGYDYSESLYDRLASDYEADSVAVFGQIEQALGTATRLTLGLRVERRSTEYSDSSGLSAGPDETMTGGELALSHDHSAVLTSYVSLSKGYKAGGFNLGVVPPGRRDFQQEEMWNLETGIKAWLLDDMLNVNLSAFYSRREDQQVRTSFQQVPGDPSSFVFYTDNAAEGQSTGLEADLRWKPDEHWEFYANLGLLDATFADFVTPEVDLTHRGQAHAPRYTYAVGGSWRSTTGWFLRADISGKDDFYFDVSNDQKSEPYSIVNLRIGFEAADWTTQLWVRNVFDEYYAVRGFYFGNEPPDFPPALYTRGGDPRHFGLTFDRRF